MAETIRFKVPLATPEFYELVAAVRLSDEHRRYVVTGVTVRQDSAWAEIEMQLDDGPS